MRIENSFTVSTPPAQTWSVLTDVERIAPCVPGATLNDVGDDGNYKGAIKVRLGPVNLTFNGEMRFTERDDDAWTANLTAAGREGRNRGSANAEVRFSLAPEGGGTVVNIATDLQLAGSIAQYGRSAGVIETVAESLIAQFTDCLEQNILSDAPAPEAPQAPIADAPKSKSLSAVALIADVIRRLVRRLFGG